jgi:hypothetical protein
MPYSVSLTTRNTLNPNPQLGNLWAAELVKRQRRGIALDRFTGKARKKSFRQAAQRNFKSRTFENHQNHEDAAPKNRSNR